MRHLITSGADRGTNRKPTVFLYRHGLAGGGAGKAVLDQARLLSSGGYQAVILASSPKVTPEEVTGLRATGLVGEDVAVLHPSFTDEPSRRIAAAIGLPTVAQPADSERSLIAWLDSLLAASNPDSVFVANAPFASVKLARTHIHRRKLAVLHGNHHAAPFTEQSPTLAAYQEVFDERRGLDGLIVLTERHAASVRTLTHHDTPVFVVPNSTQVAPRPEVQRDPLLVSMVTRLAPDKSVHEAIHAFSMVADRVPGARLEIWGTGPLKGELQALIANLGMGTAITLMGYTTDVPAAYARAACSIQTSFAEGQPLVILEAAATGRPFAAYDCLYGPQDLIEDGATGLLVPVGDRAAMADAISSLLTDPSRAEQMGDAARALVISRYAQDVVREKWEHVFAETARPAAAQPHTTHTATEAALSTARKIPRTAVRYIRDLPRFTRKHYRAAANTGRKAAKRLRDQAWYAAMRQRPIDNNLAVFAAYWGRSVSCNPAAIAAKARELAPQVRQVWVVRRSAVASLPPGTDYVVEGSLEYWGAIARAKFLVNNVNFPNTLVKRQGQVHVWTQHGTPLKHMGLALQGTPAGKGTDFAALARRCARWDYCISSNSFSSAIWPVAFPGPYELLDVGYPRNDVLTNATAEDVRRIRAGLDLSPDARVFLYMPTHRDAGRRPELDLDLTRLVDAIGPDAVILARGHYMQGAGAKIKRAVSAGRIIDATGHPRVEDLYLAADVLITDYSSAMFDYAVLERPIVIYAPDWDAYVAGRGVYFDLLEQPPGVVTTTPADLAQVLHGRSYDTPATAEQLRHFHQRFCEYDDGRAAERVVRRVFLGDATPIPFTPVETRTHAPRPDVLRPGPADPTIENLP